jgi:hypothetical protein
MTSNSVLARTVGVALACFATTGGSIAAELVQGSGHSIRLGAYAGVLFYTIEERDFRVVATVASGPDEPPIRFIAALQHGQQMVISVPRAFGQAPLEFQIVRDGDVLLVDDKLTAETAELADKGPVAQ